MQFLSIGPTSDRPSLENFSNPTEAQYNDFYKNFGECFSAWTEIEGRLLAIYILLLKSSDYDVASASFYSTTGFRAKLDLVTTVIENSKTVSSNNLLVWNKLSEKTRKKSLSRNQLAHYPIYYGRFNDSSPKKTFYCSS